MSSNYILHLRALLEKGAITQTELAAKLDVTFAALSRWLNGHARPRPGHVVAIAKLFRERVGYPLITPAEIASARQAAEGLKIKKLWSAISRGKDLLDELVLEHTYNSTSIEGTTFTKRETEAVIFGHAVVPNKSLTEHLEVSNHAAALRGILAGEGENDSLDSAFVKHLHRLVMSGFRNDAGQYSTHLRSIRGVDFHLTHPKDIPEEMTHLLLVWNRRKKISLQDIAKFHAEFELIHPFGDGNGRVGRLLLVIQCLKENFPPVIIENARKAEYDDVLEYAQRKSEFPFVLFLAEEMQRTFQLLKKHFNLPEH